MSDVDSDDKFNVPEELSVDDVTLAMANERTIILESPNKFYHGKAVRVRPLRGVEFRRISNSVKPRSGDLSGMFAMALEACKICILTEGIGSKINAIPHDVIFQVGGDLIASAKDKEALAEFGETKTDQPKMPKEITDEDIRMGSDYDWPILLKSANSRYEGKVIRIRSLTGNEYRGIVKKVRATIDDFADSFSLSFEACAIAITTPGLSKKVSDLDQEVVKQVGEAILKASIPDENQVEDFFGAGKDSSSLPST